MTAGRKEGGGQGGRKVGDDKWDAKSPPLFSFFCEGTIRGGEGEGERRGEVWGIGTGWPDAPFHVSSPPPPLPSTQLPPPSTPLSLGNVQKNFARPPDPKFATALRQDNILLQWRGQRGRKERFQQKCSPWLLPNDKPACDFAGVFVH